MQLRRRPSSYLGFACLCLSLLTLQACHTMKFEIENVQHDKVVEDTNWFFMFGWFPTREIDVATKCPKGSVAIKERTTFGDGFIEFISLGIVSPRSVWYYCMPDTNPKSAQVLLEKEKMK